MSIVDALDPVEDDKSHNIKRIKRREKKRPKKQEAEPSQCAGVLTHVPGALILSATLKNIVQQNLQLKSPQRALIDRANCTFRASLCL